MIPSAPSGSMSGLDALADPVRRALYDYVAGRHAPVTRREAAAAAGISRSLAAHHLDRLVEAELLACDYARPPGRDGPGAGRPAKRYVRAPHEIAVAMPPRNYGLLARMLADAAAADRTGAVESALVAAAAREGRAAAAEDTDLAATLTVRGYEPEITDDGDVVLNNCPFHRAAQRQPRLVCRLNHELLRAYLAGTRRDPSRAESSPCPGRCCVVVRATPAVTP